jgi:hypothetical protein
MVIRNIRYHVIGVLCLAAVALTGCDTFSTPQAKTDQNGSHSCDKSSETRLSAST